VSPVDPGAHRGVITLIVAMDRRGVIGAGGGLPWRLPGDLKRFRDVTMGKPLVMGRRTHESVGRVLPGRENIVLTRDRGFRAPGCTVLHDVASVLAHCRAAPEVMVMGGADVYALFLPFAGRIHLTRIDADVGGDTVFPGWEALSAPPWVVRESQRYPADAGNPHPCVVELLERDTGP
jgi:dihydrofolate reductase